MSGAKTMHCANVGRAFISGIYFDADRRTGRHLFTVELSCDSSPEVEKLDVYSDSAEDAERIARTVVAMDFEPCVSITGVWMAQTNVYFISASRGE